MKKILVTGVGGPAGQNVTRLLLEREFAVVGTDMRHVPALDITFHRVPAANDPSFLDELSRLAAQEKVDLVIPTVTEELPIVAESWSKRSEIPAMIGPHQAVFTANDKYLTADWLANWNVSVPRYRLPSQVKSPDEIAHAIGWPCLSKPRVGRGGRGVMVWEEKDWPSIAALDDRFILQEFMSGADYAPNVLIGRDGKAVVIVIEKTKLKEGIVGNAAEVQRAAAPDVAELAVAAAKAMSFVGPLDIDVRRRADGKPAVLEINARFGANIANASEILEAALADWGVAR
jgi:carbamoylphosphate synthase large subunit